MTRESFDLPLPSADAAASRLPGLTLPAVSLTGTDNRRWRLDALPNRAVIFVYPAMGGPGADDRLDDWTAIPGARGCTPEACSFRDELSAFKEMGVDIFGLSSQPSRTQREYASQLGLRYSLLCDDAFELATDPGLPTFEFDGRRYYKRLTLIVSCGRIEAALYPVFPPDGAADQALRWLVDR